MNKKATSYFEEIIRREDEITEKTLRELGDEFEIYKNSLNVLKDSIFCIPQRQKGKALASKFVIYAMLPRLLGTLRSMTILGLKGYYYDMRILERTFVENLGLCFYFANNEDAASNWVRSKHAPIPKIKLINEITSFFTREGKEESGIDGEAWYGKLSSFVHADVRAIASSFVTGETPKGFLFAIPPLYKRGEAREIVSTHPELLMILILHVFKTELEKRQYRKILNALKKWEKGTYGY